MPTRPLCMFKKAKKQKTPFFPAYAFFRIRSCLDTENPTFSYNMVSRVFEGPSAEGIGSLNPKVTMVRGPLGAGTYFSPIDLISARRLAGSRVLGDGLGRKGPWGSPRGGWRGVPSLLLRLSRARLGPRRARSAPSWWGPWGRLRSRPIWGAGAWDGRRRAATRSRCPSWQEEWRRGRMERGGPGRWRGGGRPGAAPTRRAFEGRGA